MKWPELFEYIASMLRRCRIIGNKQKIKDFVNTLSLILFIILMVHILACVWIYLGRTDTVNRKSWVFNSDYAFDEDDI